MVKPGQVSVARRRQAALTWWSEMACVSLTLVYTTMVWHDLRSRMPFFSSPAWFQEGFCVWRNPDIHPLIDSHSLSFSFDLIFGGFLALLNVSRWRRSRRDTVLIAATISVFDIFHGVAHLGIHLSPGILKQDVEANVFSSAFLKNFLVVFAFLGIAPFLGCAFGVPKTYAFLMHLVQVFLFVQHVPPQFAFGAVQFIINLWYCLPRLFFLSDTKQASVVDARVDSGWRTASIGILLLMPVVFAEMMLCEPFYLNFLGHFLYDASTVIFTGVYSQAVWMDAVERQKRH